MKNFASSASFAIFSIIITTIIGFFFWQVEQTPDLLDDWMVLGALSIVAVLVVCIYFFQATSRTREAALRDRCANEQKARRQDHTEVISAITEVRDEMHQTNVEFAKALDIVIKCDIAFARTSLIHLGNKYLKERRTSDHPKGYASINEQQTWIANYTNYISLNKLNGTDNGYLLDMYQRMIDIDIVN